MSKKLRFGKHTLAVGDVIYMTSLDKWWNNKLLTVVNIKEGIRFDGKSVLKIHTSHPHDQELANNVWDIYDLIAFKAKLKKKVKPISKLPKWW